MSAVGDDVVEFGSGLPADPFDTPDPAPRSGGRLASLRRAIADQQRLNARIVRVSQPESCVFDLDLRIPVDQSEVAEVGEKALKDRPKGKGGVAQIAQSEVLLAQMMLARFTVAIHAAGEVLVDATAERAAAFADPDLLEDLGARNSVDAVRRLFGNDQLVKHFADAFYAEYNADADAEALEDPTAPV